MHKDCHLELNTLRDAKPMEIHQSPVASPLPDFSDVGTVRVSYGLLGLLPGQIQPTGIMGCRVETPVRCRGQDRIKASVGPGAVAKMRAPYKLFKAIFCISLKQIEFVFISVAAFLRDFTGFCCMQQTAGPKNGGCGC